VPDFFKDLSLADLQMLQDPWGRRYLMIAQQFGSLWGSVMITFHLGVIDIPYEDENTTTGDVAEYLEEKYQIMQTFFDRYGNDIADLMSKDLAVA
jgi:hypothetical protein